MRRLGARRLRAATICVAVLWGAAACGGDDDGAAGSDAPSQSAASAATATPTPSASPSPTVEAADGVKLSLDLVTVRAPKGFIRSPALFGSTERRAASPDSIVGVAAVEIPNSDFEDLTYEQRVQIHRETVPDAKVMPPRILQGEEALHSVRRTQFNVEEEFSIIRDRHIVAVTFIQDRDLPAKEREEVVEAVLASLVWG